MIRKKIPKWLKGRSRQEKQLFLSGCPRDFWECKFRDLPSPVTIKTSKGDISPKDQRIWASKFTKRNEIRKPYRIIIASNPTDGPGLALATIWCRTTGLIRLIDISLIDRGVAEIEDGIDVNSGLVLMNFTAESLPGRVQLVRDLLYNYSHRFVAVVVSGVDDPYEWTRETLRMSPIHGVIQLNGDVITR